MQFSLSGALSGRRFDGFRVGPVLFQHYSGAAPARQRTPQPHAFLWHAAALGVLMLAGAAARCTRQITMMVALLGAMLGSAAAHDIPNDVRIQAFVKPGAAHLQLLVRVPLLAMREVDFPKRGPGYLDLARADEALATAARLWLLDNVEIYENDTRLVNPRLAVARVSLPSDKSFASYERALAHLKGPRLPESMDLYWNQQLLDVLLEFPIRSERSDFSVRPRFARLGLRVVTVLRFLPPDDAIRAFQFHGDPGLVRLDPRWHQAAARFVVSGFWHILEGIDHLLFILCLVLPFRRLAALVLIATSFTVAHSITLIAAAMGHAPGALWFPPLVETLIAVSILYMALENIIGSNVSRRWIVTFAFGLVHGFGFSFALQEELQFAGSHLISSLLAFNAGIELGQLLVLLVLVPLLDLLLRQAGTERIGIIIASAFVAHTAWHWMLERGDQLRKFPLPSPDAADAAAIMRWLMAALLIASVVWLANRMLARWLQKMRQGGVPGEKS